MKIKNQVEALKLLLLSQYSELIDKSVTNSENNEEAVLEYALLKLIQELENNDSDTQVKILNEMQKATEKLKNILATGEAAIEKLLIEYVDPD